MVAWLFASLAVKYLNVVLRSTPYITTYDSNEKTFNVWLLCGQHGLISTPKDPLIVRIRSKRFGAQNCLGCDFPQNSGNTQCLGFYRHPRNGLLRLLCPHKLTADCFQTCSHMQ